MRHRIGIASLALLLLGVDAKSAIERKCARDWPDNYVLQKVCRDGQEPAARELGALQDSIPESSVAGGILQVCINTWIGVDEAEVMNAKGDFLLAKYCYDGQVEALRALGGSETAEASPHAEIPAPTVPASDPLDWVRGVFAAWMFFGLVIAAVFGAISSAILGGKHRSTSAGFWLGFFFGPLGVLTAIVLPKGGVKCLRCGELHDPIATICPHCRANLAAAGRCRHCGKLGVPEGAKVCPWCEGGSPLSSEEATAG